jgi:hypothetical protein
MEINMKLYKINELNEYAQRQAYNSYLLDETYTKNIYELFEDFIDKLNKLYKINVKINLEVILNEYDFNPFKPEKIFFSISNIEKYIEVDIPEKLDINDIYDKAQNYSLTGLYVDAVFVEKFIDANDDTDVNELILTGIKDVFQEFKHQIKENISFNHFIYFLCECNNYLFTKAGTRITEKDY